MRVQFEVGRDTRPDLIGIEAPGVNGDDIGRSGQRLRG